VPAIGYISDFGRSYDMALDIVLENAGCLYSLPPIYLDPFSYTTPVHNCELVG
jgi:hypothetical protein